MATIAQMDQVSFDKLIKAVKDRVRLLNRDIQRAACWAIFQSIEHRNSTPADTLFQAVGTSVRRQALATFFETHGNLAYMKSEKRIEFFDAGAVYDEKAIMANAWQDAAPEPDITSAYDVVADLKRLLKKYQSAVTKSGEQKREVIHANLVPVLESLINNPDVEEVVLSEAE